MTTDAEFERIMNATSDDYAEERDKPKKQQPAGHRIYKTKTGAGNRFEDTIRSRRQRLDDAIDGK